MTKDEIITKLTGLEEQVKLYDEKLSATKIFVTIDEKNNEVSLNGKLSYTITAENY